MSDVTQRRVLESVGFNAGTKISRKQWGLEWNQALETGGWLVGDIVTISLRDCSIT